MFGIDQRVLDALVAHRTAALDELARQMGALDKAGVMMLSVAAVVGLVLVITRQWRATIVVAVSVIVARASAIVLKDVFQQRRPPRRLALVHADGWAMPSDHAAFTAAAAVALVLAIDWGSPGQRRLGAVVVGSLTAAVGFLMVYAGVHWFTDVLAGWVIGVVVAGLVDLATRALAPEAAPGHPAPSPERVSEYGTAGPFRILRGLPTMRRTEPHTEGAGRVDPCSPWGSRPGNGRAQVDDLGGGVVAGGDGADRGQDLER